MTVEMWKDFSLPEWGYDDVGGAIMYALRYSSEVLEAKREQIAQVLDSFEWLSIRNIWDEWDRKSVV